MERFSRWKQLVYSSGQTGFSLLDNIFGVYLIFFLIPPVETGMPELIHNTPLFMGLTIIGVIIIFGRIIDSLADPLVAHWSDNAKFKLGRRKFFMITGAIPFCLAAILLFYPPTPSPSTINAVYIALILGIYFFFYTYFMTPYLALIPELSHTHDDRIFITVIQAAFALLGGAMILIGVPVLWDMLQGSFEKTTALRISLIIMIALAGINMIASALPVNEKKYSVSKPADVKLLQSIKMTVTNRTFIIYMIPTILFWFSFHIVRAVIAYYPMVLLQQPQSMQTLLMVTLFGSAIAFFLIITYIAKWVSNKAIMLAGLLAFAIFMSMMYFVDTMGDLKLTAAFVHMALLGFPVAVLLAIPNAILADISEVDGHRTGKNREAMFFGTQGLFMKVNYGVAAAILSYLFAAFGKDVANPLGVKLAGPVAGIFSLAGFLIFMLYPQKKIASELKEIREEILKVNEK